MKTLSVVIPVYNTAAYLRRCLDSVLADEVLEDLELITVNDGSTDGSAEILWEYRARYQDTIRVIDKPNGGHGSAVNAGLSAATGRYFRVLDSDDWFDTPGFLRYMRLLRSCREDLIVTPYSREYADSGLEIDVSYSFLEANRVINLEDIDWKDGMDYFCLASSTWRTELLKRSGMCLLERCSYVDMQYNLCPIPLLKNMRFLQISIYRYYIGRADQSVAPERMRSQAHMHQKVLCWLIAFYGARRETLSAGKRRYFRLVLYYMIHTHCQLLCFQGQERLRAYRELRALESQLRRDTPDLYRLAGRIPSLRLSRSLAYLDVLLLPRRVHGLMAELYLKLRRAKGAEAL